MARALLRNGFVDLHKHRISLGVYDVNQATSNSYLKCGFQQEVVMRNVVRHGDDYWTLIVMGILEDEWRALHPAPHAVA